MFEPCTGLEMGDGKDRVRLAASLGVGGMATIWNAILLSTGEHVAVKIPQYRLQTSSEALGRFEGEIDLQRRLGSFPHCICYITDGHYQEVPYLVMTYCPGADLFDWLVRGYPLSQDDKYDIAKQLLLTAQHFFEHEVLHRDLKPENIRLERRQDGKIHLTVMDFGTSRTRDSKSFTLPGQIHGTPSYMAPEQITSLSSSALGSRSDLYTIGVLLCQLFTGQPPTLSTDIMVILREVVDGVVPAVNTGNIQLNRLITALRAKDPAARPSVYSALEMLETARQHADRLAESRMRLVTPLAMTRPGPLGALHDLPQAAVPPHSAPPRTSTRPSAIGPAHRTTPLPPVLVVNAGGAAPALDVELALAPSSEPPFSGSRRVRADRIDPELLKLQGGIPFALHAEGATDRAELIPRAPMLSTPASPAWTSSIPRGCQQTTTASAPAGLFWPRVKWRTLVRSILVIATIIIVAFVGVFGAGITFFLFIYPRLTGH